MAVFLSKYIATKGSSLWHNQKEGQAEMVTVMKEQKGLGEEKLQEEREDKAGKHNVV